MSSSPLSIHKLLERYVLLSQMYAKLIQKQRNNTNLTTEIAYCSLREINKSYLSLTLTTAEELDSIANSNSKQCL